MQKYFSLSSVFFFSLLFFCACVEEPEPQPTFSGTDKIELADPQIRYKDFAGVWQFGTNVLASVPSYPATTAKYCEGNQSWTGTFDWDSRTANYFITIGACNNNLRIVYYRHEGGFVANYIVTRWGGCSNPGNNLWVTITKSNQAC